MECGYIVMELAENIARRAHADQLEESTGDPYILHIERVVGLVETDEQRAVAWLHDVIEDSSITAADLLALGVSEPIVEAVVLLTRQAGESYADYIQRLAGSANEIAIAVKLADLRDHLRPNCPGRLRDRYRKALTFIAVAPFRTYAGRSSAP